MTDRRDRVTERGVRDEEGNSRTCRMLRMNERNNKIKTLIDCLVNTSCLVMTFNLFFFFYFSCLKCGCKESVGRKLQMRREERFMEVSQRRKAQPTVTSA